MGLFEQINTDIKSAMKAKEQDKLTALRAIKSEFLLIKTSDKPELTDEVEIKVLKKLVKQRKDAAGIYKNGDRKDLYNKEIAEMAIIEKYLPEQLSEEEITKIITQVIEQTGASSPKDMGKVMGVATKQLAGKADNKLIAAKVKEILNT